MMTPKMRRRKLASGRVRYHVDYEDAGGKRRWSTHDTEEDQKRFLATVLKQSLQIREPSNDLNVTFRDYAERWLEMKRRSLEESTVRNYAGIITHAVESFGNLRVREITRSRIKGLALELSEKRTPTSVRHSISTLASIFESAILTDEIILTNPARGACRGIIRSTGERQIKALESGQLAGLLEDLRVNDPWFHPQFLVLARTGLRISESLGLLWTGADFDAACLHITRQKNRWGTKERLKTSAGYRNVDLSDDALACLRRLAVTRKEQTLAHGWGTVPELVFITSWGTPATREIVGWHLKKALRRVGLSGHFSAHSLRHTYASLLLQRGADLEYVKRQLGHSSIKMTSDLYGRWLPMSNRAMVNRLDEVGDV